MRRRLVVLSVAAASGLMAQNIGYDLMNVPGVSLLPANSNSALASVNQALNAGLSSLLPYSLVLQNNSRHMIVAYTLHLDFADQAGRLSGHNRVYFNLENKSNGMEVEPGGIRLVTPVDALHLSGKATGIGPSQRDAAALTSQIAAQKTVTVSLDLLVFDTGQVFGKDQFQTLSFLRGYISGGQEAANLVETGLANGSSPVNIAVQLKNLARSIRNTADPGAMGRTSQIQRLAQTAGQNSLDRLLSEVQSIRGMPAWNFYR